MRVSIIVLNWNGKNDTLACLHSLQLVDYPSFDIIVVDNGSSDDSVEAIRTAFPLLTLLENKTNLGYAGGNNVGIRFALQKGADAILILNNDTLVDTQLLSAFTATAVDHPDVGIFGAKIYLYDHKKTLDHIGGKWNRERAAFDLIGHREIDEGQWNKVQSLEYACGCALFIKRAVFDSIGLFEEKFFLFWEEADFCFRAKKAGFPTFFCPYAKVWHKVSASFGGGKPHIAYFLWRGRFLWISRNGGKDKGRLFGKLFLELSHKAKLYLLKNLQFFIGRKSSEKRQRLAQYRAALCGAKDFFLHRFGPGPSWICNKRSEL